MAVAGGRHSASAELQSSPTDASSIALEPEVWTVPSQHAFAVFHANDGTDPNGGCIDEEADAALTPLTKVEMPIAQMQDNHFMPLEGALVDGAFYEQQTMDAGSLAHLIGDYIDYLIEDNERITQISRAYTLPTPLDFEKEQYFHEVRNSDTRFPTTRFRAWLEVCHGNHIEIVAPVQHQPSHQIQSGTLHVAMQPSDSESQQGHTTTLAVPGSPGDESFASSCTANDVS